MVVKPDNSITKRLADLAMIRSTYYIFNIFSTRSGLSQDTTRNSHLKYRSIHISVTIPSGINSGKETKRQSIFSMCQLLQSRCGDPYCQRLLHSTPLFCSKARFRLKRVLVPCFDTDLELTEYNHTLYYACSGLPSDPPCPCSKGGTVSSVAGHFDVASEAEMSTLLPPDWALNAVDRAEALMISILYHTLKLSYTLTKVVREPVNIWSRSVSRRLSPYHGTFLFALLGLGFFRLEIYKYWVQLVSAVCIWFFAYNLVLALNASIERL